MSRPKPPSADRRRLMTAGGAAGALAAAAAAVPLVRPADPLPPSARKDEASDASAGYRLSEHVLHYYRTARV